MNISVKYEFFGKVQNYLYFKICTLRKKFILYDFHTLPKNSYFTEIFLRYRKFRTLPKKIRTPDEQVPSPTTGFWMWSFTYMRFWELCLFLIGLECYKAGVTLQYHLWFFVAGFWKCIFLPGPDTIQLQSKVRRLVLWVHEYIGDKKLG